MARGAECRRDYGADPAATYHPDTGHDSSPFVPVLEEVPDGVLMCAPRAYAAGLAGVTGARRGFDHSRCAGRLGRVQTGRTLAR